MMVRTDLRWSIEQRLEFIEFCLFWEGQWNCGHLMNAFGVMVNQSFISLNRYIRMALHNMVYGKSAQTYLIGTEFEPLFLKPDASRYLSQLCFLADSILNRTDTWIGRIPLCNAAPTPKEGVNVNTLKSLVAAGIRRFKAIEVMNQSLSRPEPRWCWIAPYAIRFSGFRWLTRAFCSTDQTFKHFLFSRNIETQGTKPKEMGHAADAFWNEQAIFEIGPHPELSEAQQKVMLSTLGCAVRRPRSQFTRRFSITRSSA